MRAVLRNTSSKRVDQSPRFIDKSYATCVCKWQNFNSLFVDLCDFPISNPY